VVIANRAGRQAIIAKVIIDATPRASVARMAGARFRPYPAGKHKFLRYVIGGDAKNAPGVTGRKLDLAYRGDGTLRQRSAPPEKSVPIIEYELDFTMTDGSYASFANAEMIARDLTFDPGQKAAAEELFEVPPDELRAARPQRGTWQGTGKLDLAALQPSGMPEVFVLGGSAGIPRQAAARLLRPAALIEVGARAGASAAEAAVGLPSPLGVAVPPRKGAATGDVRELLSGAREATAVSETVASPETSVGVLGSYDVVVVGGGTGGAPAAIAAARSGAKTLVVEYLYGLGGVGTMGMISRYWWGYRGGFTREAPGVGSTAAGDNPRFEWDPLHRSEWYRREIRKAGGDIWYGVIGAGAYLEGSRVEGVVVVTPEGRGVVLAKTVIDATGNADVAAAAGAQTVTTGPSEIAVQGTGLPSINLGTGYNNTDFTITDETDMTDIWHMMVYSKTKYSTQFDMGQLIDSRERRRIVGDLEMGVLDQHLGRSYPDTVSVAYSNFDTHGYTVDSYFLIDHPEKKGISVDVPYRCFLPKGLDGLLVIGIGMSVHRDALPLVRMQPDVQNHGYAAGLAAATAAREGKTVRGIDVRELQKKLVTLEIVPARVLADKDSFPLPEEKVAGAVAGLPEDTRLAAVLLSQPEVSSPLLRKAYAAASDEKNRLAYAMMLGVLGDATGLEMLMTAADAQPWDAGWNYTGMGQFGGALSLLDRYLVAMGRTRDPRALDSILRKARQLTPASEFSHFRAVALALETIGDPRGAEVLAGVLRMPGMRGHAITVVEQAARATGLNVNETHTRGFSIRELSLARALYRCGDRDGIGAAILKEYTSDLRGHLARHARAVLEDVKIKP
jgi:hypothetical protein